MYKHILISTDGSDVAQKGVDQGLDLAKAIGARVTLITVTEPFPIYASAAGGWVPAEMANYDEIQKEHAQRILGRVKEAADKLGVTNETLHVPNTPPAEAIIEAAKSRGCDLITMGSHGRRGLGRLLLGSQTSEVLSHAPVPVLVVR
ncbi:MULTISPECIES: universal stress protein [Phenylobacterium]|uniref:Universal stress protein n=1 Tax=Phenylobacterium koreense TaxID=266125 RepID=A0ABV2EMU0_9CAUL